MKKVFWAAGFLGLLACLYVMTGAETKTSQIQVTATVPDEVYVEAYALSFGILQGLAQQDATTHVTVRAPIGREYRISLDAGQNYIASGMNWRSLKNGDSYILYTLYLDPEMTQQWGDVDYGDTYPWGNPNGPFTGTGGQQPYEIYARANGYNFSAPGEYNDVVTVTVHY